MSTTTAYIKAILAAIVAGLGALSTGLTADGISAAEGVSALSATLVALGVVYAVPNKGVAEGD